jgi:FkbM family methyltransferase
MEIVAPSSMLPHVNKVLAGEYDVDYASAAPVVVDLGANVGSFAVWALHRWPQSIVHCYEPLPTNFELLRRNLGALEGTRVHLHNCAIGDPARTKMFLGRNNCGEASFYDLGEQGTDQVEVVTWAPDCLPEGQILKLDTEGSEVDILSRMAGIDFDIVLLEFHGEDNRRRVDVLLHDYVLVGATITRPHRGVLKYAHRRLS